MADPDLSGRKLGEFVVRELLGKGGYGDVYRATQSRLKRDVVIKVFRQGERDSDGARDRFLREAQIASRLHHPYAAHVYASGAESDGLLWIAMELVEGVTLEAWLQEHGRMPLEQFVPFFECVAEVVQVAHKREIVHRDLKPSNVMVIECEERLLPKLLDLGIAKARYEVTPRISPPAPVDAQGVKGEVTPSDPAAQEWRLTRSGAGIGSWPYMSPEQWRNSKVVGPASDIYSLGILAYRALSGREPFTGEGRGEYYHHHLQTKVPPLGRDFPSALDRVLQRALAKTPEARHGTARELASDLRAVLRASKRELIRSSAQRWDDHARAPGLLLGGAMLVGVERWRRRTPPDALSELECSYIAASHRRARQSARVRRLAVPLAAVLVLGFVLGVLQYRAAKQTELAEAKARSAQQVADATRMESELEQGRSALLHGEPDAEMHLAEACRLGDHSASTAFMRARALQSRLTELARFASSFGRMWSSAFSPDGRQIVTTDDRSAQVWDAQTYQLRFTLPHGAEVYHALYSPDGTRLVTVAQDAVRIWDATRGALVHELTRKRGDGKPADYFIGTISSDGKLVSAIDASGAVVHVWDAVTGAPLAELRNDASDFPALAFSSDGHWLAATGGNDVRMFDTRTWRTAVIIRGPGIHGLAFDPTGPRVLTGAATGDAAIWSIPSGARLRHLREIGEPIDAVAFSPDGQLVAAASRDGAEQVWQAGSGKLQSQLNPRHSKIRAVEFDPTSKLVLSAGYDGSVVVADAALGMPLTVLEGPKNIMLAAHFDPSSRRVIGASLDGTARLWDATALYRRWSSPPVSDDCGIITTPDPDRRFVAVGCRGRATRVWDTSRNQLIAELPGMPHVDGDFTSAFPAVSSTGDRAAIARGNVVEVYELPGARLLHTIAHGAAVNAVAFASTGRDIVSGAVDGSLLVTRDNGALLTLPISAGGIDAAALLPDGRVVASDAQRRLRVYDRVGAVLANLELPARVMSLRIEGTRLVTVPIYTGDTAPPLLVDLERYRVIAQLVGHVGRVFSARWVSGDRIITAGGDGTARLWDGSTGQLRQIYRGGPWLLADATLSPDGSMIIAGGGDGLLRFWDPSSGLLIWTLQAHKSPIISIHVEGGDIVTRGFTGELSRWTLPRADQVIEACGDHEHCVIVPK